MPTSQFRVLHREFLFRIVDLEVLSARADLMKLLGQLAALLAAISFMIAGSARRLADMTLAGPELVITAWPMIHFLAATTMLMVGLFAVLSWDATFPDRRDVLVLGPLPVSPVTMFRAKLSALGVALCLTVAMSNVFTGISYPLVLGFKTGGLLSVLRSLCAYWLTMAAAGAFVLCSVLTVQGFAAQLLPRRYFLRFSAVLQLLAFCSLLSVYFLQPPMATPVLLSNASNQTLLARLPSYWFLGLFQWLTGPMHPAMEPLVRRAAYGLAISIAGATTAFLLCYFRTLRKIVDEPDIVPGAGAATLRIPFGDSLREAVVNFSARTLLRSRQHRVILAFYIGIGGAIALACARAIIYRKNSTPWNSIDGPLMIASIILLFACIVGARVVFTMPIALRSNWVFKVTALREAGTYFAAVRRALLLLAAFPVWLASAALFLTVWPLPQALEHLFVLLLMGFAVCDLSLHKLHKIPFTCSYLPGKMNVHTTSALCALVLVVLTDVFARVERAALGDAKRYLLLVTALAAFAYWAHRRNQPHSGSPAKELQFEETPIQDIYALELHRDGAI